MIVGSLHPFGQQGFQGQHHARKLAARGDALDGLRRHSRIGREEELHAVAARASRLCEGCQGDAENRLGHAQPGEGREDVFLESRSGLFARLVQTVGQRRGLFGGFR